MVRFFATVSLLCCCLMGASCQESTPDSPERPFQPMLAPDSVRGTFPYRLTNPDRSIELPATLIEVSGMAWLSDTALLMIQDEIGYVFRLNPVTGTVKQHIRFAGNGDFEEIVVAQDEVWVLRSDAKLYQFSTEAGDNADDDKWYPSIPSNGDYEAMAFLPEQGLLMAAKEPVTVNGNNRDHERAIFLIPPQEPESWSVYHVLDLRQVETYLDAHTTTEHLENLKESFQAKKKKSFKPSAMAIHPQSGHLYILASVGKLLLVCDREGLLLHVQPLPEDLFPQPEGMCFGPDGTLFISHEGVNAPARVHIFSPENIH